MNVTPPPSLTQEREWDIDTLPNRLTLLRIILIPIILLSLFFVMLNLGPAPILNTLAAAGFLVAAATDFLDGHIARKQKMATIFGSFLDPVADKFLVVSSLIMLQALGRIPVLLVIILVLREIYVTALRLLAGQRGLALPVQGWGKVKTALQMVSIPMLMAPERPWDFPLRGVGTALIYLAGLASLYSSLQYSRGLLKKLKSKRRKHAPVGQH